MITSTHNPKIQWVRKLQSQAKFRREEQACVVEGVRLVEEAFQSGWQARLVLYSGELSPRGLRLVQQYQAAGAAVEEVTASVLAAASDTPAPQGILAVLTLQPSALPPAPDFVLIADGVRDPGNLGTLLRSAAAAGVQAVLLPPETADAFAPKVLRAAMGAHFYIPVLEMDWEQIRCAVHPGGGQDLQVYLADSSGGMDYTSANLRRPVALVIGGEAAGAGSQAAALADAKIHIPMPGRMESLNAAVAAAVLLFEVARQRKEPRHP